MRRHCLVAALVTALLTAAAAGCGSSDAAAPSGQPVSVEAARVLDGSVDVEGYLIAGAEVELCDMILESYPPQCGGATLVVEGADLDALTTSEAAGVRWSDDPVTLSGTVDDGVLDVR